MAKKKKVVKSVKSEKLSNVPTGVKVISVFYQICAFLLVIFGLLIAIASSAIISYLITIVPEIATVKYGTLVAVGVVLGILMIGLGVLLFFIGRGLWKLRQWARITAIVLAALGVISVITSMIRSFEITRIINLAIDLFIGLYLLLGIEVKKAFK